MPPSVGVPAASVMPGTASNTYVAGDVISSFAVSTPIPGAARRNGAEGLLPLHITFNLPCTHLLVAPKWEGLLDQWHETGDIKSEFARSFSFYLRSGDENHLNLIQELEKQGYGKLVKVFLDEKRGVLTVSDCFNTENVGKIIRIIPRTSGKHHAFTLLIGK